MQSRPLLEITTVVIVITIAVTPMLLSIQIADAFSCRDFVDAPIAASGQKVYVSWATNKSGNWEIMFRASSDSGKTFADKINLSNSPSANSFHSAVAASGENNVYVSFDDDKTGNVDTYVRASTDGGKTFGPLVKISGTGNLPQKPLVVPADPLRIQEAQEDTMIAASANNVFVVSWDKKSGNWEVLLAASHDNGATFGDTINLSNSANAKSDRAWLEAEGNNVYVSWWESAGGKQEPVMRVSNDNGVSFGPLLRLASNGTIGGAG